MRPDGVAADRGRRAARPGYTKHDIASALGFRRENHETLYERAPGKDCVVLRVLTFSDEVEAAQSAAGNLPTALAVNFNGDANVIFGDFFPGSFAPAESDLNSLSE